MTPEAALAEIRRLLTEAYEHYFKHSDGHCKPNEGAITVHYPPFFWTPEPDGPREPELEIFSYALGPSRSHRFKTATEALEAVQQWHRDEMETND